jgi:YaiO family outer membrane protein
MAVALLWCVAAARASDVPGVNAAVEQRDYAHAASLLRAALASDPNDEAVRFELAQVLGWAGDFDAALAEYDALAAQQPANVDYALGRSQVLGWQGRDSAALAELTRARALAPDYEAVWQLELAILRRNEAMVAAREKLQTLAAARFPDATWWRAAELDAEAARFEPKAQLTFGASRDSLSTGVPDWQSLFASVRYPLRGKVTPHGTLTRDERFGATDTALAGGADWRVSQRWSMAFEVAVVPDAEFSPRRAATVSGQRALRGGWETEVRFRHRAYADAEVASAGGTVARYVGDFRAHYGIDLVRLRGTAAATTTHSAGLAYYRSARSRFDVSVVSGREAEAVGPGVVLRTEVRGFNVGGRQALGERWGASWWLGSQRQGDLYRRRYVGVAVTRER